MVSHPHPCGTREAVQLPVARRAHLLSAVVTAPQVSIACPRGQFSAPAYCDPGAYCLKSATAALEQQQPGNQLLEQLQVCYPGVSQTAECTSTGARAKQGAATTKQLTCMCLCPAGLQCSCPTPADPAQHPPGAGARTGWQDVCGSHHSARCYEQQLS